MSKGHKRIADYVLEHYDRAAYMTAAKLGESVGISESTVVRFAYELGFASYPEFQRKLCSMLRSRLTSVQRIEVSSNQMGKGDIFETVLNSDIEKIRATISGSSRESFYRAVDLIAGAKTVYIMGARSAEMLASFLAYYLQIMLPDVRQLHAAGTSEQFQRVLHLGSDDVIIGISFPRYSKQTLKIMQYSAKQGAKVIAVTDSPAAPIASTADTLLLASSDMVSFADSLVAPLSLVNALIAALGAQLREQLSNKLEALERIWDEYDVYERDEN